MVPTGYNFAHLMTLAPAQKLGPYEILAPLGAGGMGEVYRARDTRLERIVAIKVLPSSLSSDSSLRQRLEREAKSISRLSHPHICTLHDIGHEDGVDFLVMEYLEGETVAPRSPAARANNPLCGRDRRCVGKAEIRDKCWPNRFQCVGARDVCSLRLIMCLPAPPYLPFVWDVSLRRGVRGPKRQSRSRTGSGSLCDQLFIPQR